MLNIPSSVQIASIRGIPIRLHITFLAVLPLFAFLMGTSYFAPLHGGVRPSDFAWGAGLAVVLFACVTLHELSHSLMAQRYHIRVRSITLLPIGGVSQMEDMPREPRMEFLVSAVGPLTNFVLAAPLLAVGLGWLGPVVPSQPAELGEFVRTSGWINLGLGVFNFLLPAFPMDGGRILRAALATRMPFPKATRYAARVGRALAFAMGLLGFFTLPGGVWLLLIAFFIYVGASEEERVVEVMSTLGNLRVRDLMTASPVVLRPEDTLEDAFRVMLDTKHLGFPVVDADGRIAGFLGLQELGKVPRPLYPTTSVATSMRQAVPHIAPDALATDALKLMGTTQEEHLVVMDHGRLAGLLSKTDVSRVVRILSVERGGPQVEVG